jgi:hypothetical protein
MKEMILGTIRHILTTAGGVLAGNSAVVGEADVQTAVGAVMALIGLVWSIWDKKARS